jgi:hypothetical protein
MRARWGLWGWLAFGAVAASCGSKDHARPPPAEDWGGLGGAGGASAAGGAGGQARPDASAGASGRGPSDARAGDAQVVPATKRATVGPAGINWPAMRYGHAMAFDQARGRVVLFGGHADLAFCPAGQFCDDTWEYNGVTGTWEKRTPVGGSQPTPRTEHAMAYDPVRERVLLFGGNDGTFCQDLWEWDGVTGTWTDRTPPGAKPTPRQNAGLVWDVARSRAVLFGGGETDGANPKSDTWEWDGASGTWILQNPATPPAPRQGHGMAYDPDRQRVLMFGGSTGSGYKDDTWEWNGTAGQWTLLALSAPAPAKRFFPRMEFDVRRARIVLYGGMTDLVTDAEVWEWDNAYASWTDMGTSAPMPSRAYHAMAYDSTRATLVVFGGINIEVANGASLYLDDLWEL